LLPHLRENILLNIFEFKEAARVNLQRNKIIFKWWPFWNKVYKHTNDNFLDDFPKIYEDSSKVA